MSPFLVWTIVALLVIPAVALAIYSVVDLAKRDDIRLGAKVAWILLVVLVPLVGGILYLIFRPTRPEDIRGFGRRRRQQQRVDRLLEHDDGAAPDEDGAV